MKTYPVGILTSSSLLLFAASSAMATSCSPMVDRYFISCADRVCNAEFRVAQVQAFGTCGRRPEVREVDPKTGRQLALLASHFVEAGVGTYEVRLVVPYWRYQSDDSWDALRNNFDASFWCFEDECSVVAMDNPEQMRKLRESKGDWLTRRSDEPGFSIQSERRRVERAAARELASSIALQSLYWLSFAVALVAVVFSLHDYYARLYGRPEGKRGLTVPAGIQLAVLAVALATMFAIPFDFWPGILLIPAVVVVLIAEGWSRMRLPSRVERS